MGTVGLGSFVYSFQLFISINAVYFPFEKAGNIYSISDKYYFKAWTRITPYIIGLITGIQYAKFKQSSESEPCLFSRI